MSSPTEMMAVEIRNPGGPEALAHTGVPVPSPGNGEVLIRVAAAGVNGPDLAQRRGLYAPPPGASPLPGLEVAGEVVAIGPGADDWRQGHRVMALTNGGGYAEYVAVPQGQVLPAPAGWTLQQAAAVPETYFTIVQTLVIRAGLAPDMTVLIEGAAGGLGGAAVVIARTLGATPIAVVSSPAKAEYALSLGAAHAIDRSLEDVGERTLALTDGRGADRIVHVSGAAGLAACMKAAARGAHILELATLGGAKAEINLAEILSRQLTISGSTLRPQTSDTKAAIARTIADKIAPAMANPGFPRPALRPFPLADASQAHAAMESDQHYGKIVLITDWGRTQSH
ncbi:NAD(P)H quinone oxidoreductase [Devosia pacifica]|uniref:NAD(P)H quinone oxidoreductase n=1 Tax=Devosia pacifica TaxID=1335967 RepID=A0A918VYP2_9HYPH|nr:NAD(P)H-quinone oxidoreductase [Devosia pacifica]GHA38098.1 NAD(P)H quinone oxidoreductase [Devosia pacifica]